MRKRPTLRCKLCPFSTPYHGLLVNHVVNEHHKKWNVEVKTASPEEADPLLKSGQQLASLRGKGHESGRGRSSINPFYRRDRKLREAREE